MSRSHGTRSCYIMGCRLPECREANRVYQRARKRRVIRRRYGLEEDVELVVSTAEARVHLAFLARSGIGQRTVAALSGLDRSTVHNIATGRRQLCKPATAERILGVGLHLAIDGNLIDAGPTWRLIDEMVATGAAKVWIARQLGYRGRGIQIRRTRCTAANARKVEQLARLVLARRDAERELMRDRMRDYRARKAAA